MKHLGVRFMGVKKILKYRCEDCSNEVSYDYKETKEIPEGNLVVTSVISGSEINEKFLASLKTYCRLNRARLIILPVNNEKHFTDLNIDRSIQSLICYDNLSIGNATNIMGAIKLGATLESPLHGITPFSKGKNVVFGHPQIQLKTLPRKAEKYPTIITTTGTISLPNYGENKTAQKANFNHSFAALFIDGNNPSKMRHLNFDGDGFYDINGYYTETGRKQITSIEAIVTGDEHVLLGDKDVAEATYGKGGIVDTLKPKYIVRHDVLDCYSVSHHHKYNVFTRYAKHIGGVDSIENELNQTLDFIKKTTPKNAVSIIIPSNHNSHLLRWLQECDPKHDMVNAKIYHQLMCLMLSKVTLENNMAKYPDPFTEWASDKIGENIKFLSPADTFIISDIDINNHGDLGVNGSRGSNTQYKDLPLKSIIGHSHSPGIAGGSYQVGTSSHLRLEYNCGLSSWDQTHCIIYPNGKRQLIFIRDGEWK